MSARGSASDVHALSHGKMMTNMAAAKKLSYDMFGLDMYETDDGKEWAVGTQAQVNKAVRATIDENLWTFNADFIGKIVGLSASEKKSLRKMQEVMSDECNLLVRRIVGERNIDRLVKEALAADGAGNMLSTYDGKEYDSNDIEGLPKGKLAYRIN